MTKKNKLKEIKCNSKYFIKNLKVIKIDFILLMFQARTAKGFLIEVPLVFNNYQIMNQIKSGAFSVVVKVKDQETKEMLAAKIISKKDMKKRKAIKIINKEIELLQKINHPNIVKLKKVLEIENENEEEFIIMIEE